MSFSPNFVVCGFPQERFCRIGFSRILVLESSHNGLEFLPVLIGSLGDVVVVVVVMDLLLLLLLLLLVF